jgi:hypothetical protein
MLQSRLRPKAELAGVEIEGEIVLYDIDADTMHLLNPSAALVFSLLDGEATLREVCAEIASACAVDQSVIERDVVPLVSDLADKGLFEGEGVADVR